MKREAKVWGERWLIRQDSTHAVSYLKIEKGYECSFHRHQEKYNLFVVLSGRIAIIVEQFDHNSTVYLTEGQSFTTKPGERHKFVGFENSDVIEEMYVEYREDDIQRENKGGKTQLAPPTFTRNGGLPDNMKLGDI
jgi:mannose-6-phosphate isomerase-like protein (cupin superfamily)